MAADRSIRFACMIVSCAVTGPVVAQTQSPAKVSAQPQRRQAPMGNPAELIKPSATDPQIKTYDQPHVVIRPENDAGTPPIALFLPGTGGTPSNSRQFLHVIAGQGYRTIGLEYNDQPAVQQVCPNVPNPDCAAKFREMRIWATGGSKDATNSVSESIVGRLVSLLKYLQAKHPTEHWDAYLTADGKPVWSRFVVSGLSQGAGMAAYIAKRETVARVVCFSSPIDMLGGRQSGNELPAWLSMPSATPHDRWYAERNSREPFNPGLIRSYAALGIPADHIRVFSLDLPAGTKASNPMVYHGINIRDLRYTADWQFLFGSPAQLDPSARG